MSSGRNFNTLLSIAMEAKYFAQQTIVKGSTQLNNNQLPDVLFTALKTGISDMRTACQTEINYDLEDRYIYHYRRQLQHAIKYSLGNCHEQALIALEYIRSHYPHIFAEIIHVKSKSNPTISHAVLVLGRSPNSTPDKPASWDAIVCDPWKDEVYHSSQYRDKLGVHYLYFSDFEDTGSVREINCFEPFNCKDFYTFTYTNFNTTYLHEHMTVAVLKNKLTMRMDQLSKTFELVLKDVQTNFPKNRASLILENDILLLLKKIINETKKYLNAMTNKNYEDAYRISSSFHRHVYEMAETVNDHYFALEKRNTSVSLMQLRKNNLDLIPFINASLQSEFMQEVETKINLLKEMLINLNQSLFAKANLSDFKNEIKKLINKLNYEAETCCNDIAYAQPEVAITRMQDFYKIEMNDVAFIADTYQSIVDQYQKELLAQKADEERQQINTSKYKRGKPVSTPFNLFRQIFKTESFKEIELNVLNPLSK